MFRGILFQCPAAVLGPTMIPLVLQAIAFGFIHFAGVPNGWPGVGLAATYGFLLGLIKRCSGGMLAPFLTHVIADLARVSGDVNCLRPPWADFGGLIGGRRVALIVRRNVGALGFCINKMTLEISGWFRDIEGKGEDAITKNLIGGPCVLLVNVMRHCAARANIRRSDVLSKSSLRCALN